MILRDHILTMLFYLRLEWRRKWHDLPENIVGQTFLSTA